MLGDPFSLIVCCSPRGSAGAGDLGGPAAGRRLAGMNDWNAQVIEEFRANHGAVGGRLAGAPLVLVTHRGARSGALRTSPLGYFDDESRMILFASAMGAHTNPAWYHNLVANPRVTVELGDGAFEADAQVLEGDERSAVWERAVAALPFLADHQAKTGGRPIPLIALERAS